VADLEPDRVERTVALITEAGGTALPYRCDVSVEAEVQALVAATVDAYGPSTCSAPTPGSPSEVAWRRPTPTGSGSGR
jgi:hypothetical protein